jgi:Flp pilus assembly protein TadD
MHKPEAPRQAINDIFRLISSGQLEQAEHKCSSMLITHPRDINILGLHGAILLKLGRSDDAQQALLKAIAMEPGFAKPYEDLGRLFLIRNEPEQAVRHFSQAIELDGSEASAYSGLASALAKLGRADEAKAAHQQFLELSPIAGTLLKAEQLLREDDGAGAEELCNELLKREPENAEALRLLARIASDDERHVVTEKLLRRIINLLPNEYLPYNQLGRFLTEQSRFLEAIELFEQAASLNDSVVDNFRLLGDAQAVIGSFADALASYQQALKLYPEDPHALAGLGHMQREPGQPEGLSTVR